MSHQPPYPQYQPYGYYVQVPSPQPPRRSSLAWLWITLSVVGGVLIVCCVGTLALGAVGALRGNGTATINNGPLGTAGPTTTPPLTPTALGDPLSAFSVAYGAETGTLGDYHIFAATIDHRSVAVDAAVAPSVTGDQLVSQVRVRPQDQVNAQIAFTIAQSFLPTDASQPQSISTTDGSQEIAYHSVTLASDFPPSMFITLSGQTAAPGTVAVECEAPDASGAVSACLVVLGE